MSSPAETQAIIFKQSWFGKIVTVVGLHDVFVEAARVRVAFRKAAFRAAVGVLQHVGLVLGGPFLVSLLIFVLKIERVRLW
jgi:hypothetical protein